MFDVSEELEWQIWLPVIYWHLLGCQIFSRWCEAPVSLGSTMTEVQATVEFSVELHKFYNVDLFQRG